MFGRHVPFLTQSIRFGTGLDSENEPMNNLLVKYSL